MRVSVTPTEDDDLGAALRIEKDGEPASREVLAHRARLASGVHLDVELAGPCIWSALLVRPGDAPRPVVDSIVGSGTIDTESDHRATSIRPSLAVPGLRVAVLDALDRWLQLPLDQSLVDAERAVSRWRMAREIADGAARRGVVGDALVLARRAGHGLASYLHERADDAVVTPDLLTGLRGLVEGYDELRREVDGHDDELAVVAAGWGRLTGRVTERQRLWIRKRSPILTPSPTRPRHSVIDPRQSFARTFALAADPATAEVSVADAAEPETLTVRAPAFGPGVAPDLLSRLMVRLVDRRSGELGGHALLATAGRSPHPDGPVTLEASVPLAGLHRDRVRADLFDVMAMIEPTADDADARLHDVRRAVTVLGGWRHLLGLSRTPVRPDEASVLREHVRALEDTTRDADPHEPICAGAPTRDELTTIATLDDEGLVSHLRAHETPGPWADVHRLTVAELAAADTAVG
jgi:hypothetical protein